MTLNLSRSGPQRYLVSLLTSGAASLVTAAINPWFVGRSPLIFFVIAIAASAGYGGIGPGLLATGLNLVVVLLFFQPQVVMLTLSHATPVLFVCLGIGLSLMMGRLQRTNMMLARTKERLETANDRLASRTEDLSRANEELQRFAYALAHDLSAPLRSVAALTDLLMQRNAGKFDESSRECAEMIVSRVRRTQGLIKGLLDYAAAVEGPEDGALVDCNLAVRHAMEDLESAIRETSAQITIDPLPSLRATSSHLTQIFSNLISNAIKYRPTVRQPQIHIAATERSDDWLFCVSDNGIGLDMKYADRIFGMFNRLHGEREYKGNGIGLAMCKILIQRHRGRIWVESEVGKGCRFFFTIPKSSIEEVAAEDRRSLIG